MRDLKVRRTWNPSRNWDHVAEVSHRSTSRQHIALRQIAFNSLIDMVTHSMKLWQNRRWSQKLSERYCTGNQTMLVTIRSLDKELEQDSITANGGITDYQAELGQIGCVIRSVPMLVTCCQCGNGPYVADTTAGCVSCGHYVCSFCICEFVEV